VRQGRCGEDCLDLLVKGDLVHLGEENDDRLVE
jgi:hypothetical protein